MSKKTLFAGAVGSAFVASMTAAPLASAAENPFALTGLSRAAGSPTIKAQSPGRRHENRSRHDLGQKNAGRHCGANKAKPGRP